MAAAKGKGDGKAAAEVKDSPTADEPQETPPANLPPTQEELRAQLESGELKVLSKKEILESDDLVEEIFVVDEWGGAVIIRSFSKGKQIEIDERATVDDEIDPRKIQMFAFLEGVITPEFALEDQEKLKDKNAAAFDRIVSRIFELSALGKKAADEAEARFREGPG